MRKHSLLERIFGIHKWVLQPNRIIGGSHYYFRQGGSGVFYYDCFCGAKKKREWYGEYEEGRELTDEEKKALGPYL